MKPADTRATLVIPRKNGKTLLAAVVHYGVPPAVLFAADRMTDAQLGGYVRLLAIDMHPASAGSLIAKCPDALIEEACGVLELQARRKPR